MPHDRFVWEPSSEVLNATTLAAFLREHRPADYEALLTGGYVEPHWFGDELLRFLEVRF